MGDESLPNEVEDIFRGAYTAERAAALSGVPRSTLYYWARHEVWEPSLRRTKPRLWTYADVLALRLIHWLLLANTGCTGVPIKASTMSEVRLSLSSIRQQAHAIWHEEVRVLLDRSGRVFFRDWQGTWEHDQVVAGDFLDLLAQFSLGDGATGPDLIRPRPTLRILPGKLSGEPHIEGTRLATIRLAALVEDGLELADILQLYPDISEGAVSDAVDLERQLQANAA